MTRTFTTDRLAALRRVRETVTGRLRDVQVPAVFGTRRRKLAAAAAAGTMLVVPPAVAFGTAGHATTPVTGGPAATAQAAPGAVPTDVAPDQVDNAKAIAKAAADRGLGEQAVKVAVATAFQESGLHNIDYGDRDSVGLFQQRPSQGWGSVDQIMDPQYSAGKFLDGLKQVPDWDKMPTTVAAQTVQKSGFPEAYAKWEAKAGDLAHAVTPTVDGHGHGDGH